MALIQYLATGRRKQATARIFLRPGTGKITVNGKPLEAHFNTYTSKSIVRQALLATETADKFDVVVNTQGGGLTGQAGAVRLGIKPAARYSQSEFSSTKMLSWAQNLVWYEQARERGLDEYVLLNERGDIAECTSANIFAVFGNTVCTPPLSSGCLPGVTRALLLTEIKVPGYTTVERPLTPADLEKADQVLISSTTRDLLVVESIEGLKIRSECHAGAILEEALSAYRARYIQEHATAAPVR